MRGLQNEDGQKDITSFCLDGRRTCPRWITEDGRQRSLLLQRRKVPA